MDYSLPTGIRHWLGEIISVLPLNLHVDCWGAERFDARDVQNPSLPEMTLKIRHPGVIRNLLLSRDPLNLIDAYLNGAIDVSGALEAAIPLVQKNPHARIKFLQLGRVWLEAWTLPRLPGLRRQSPWARLRARTKERDQRVIQHHYDVGNQFYRLWLDRHLVYSCAHFEHPQMSLDEAQEAKLDLICRKLKLSPGESLLDIGCGWGALLRWAAKHYGANGYGITLSQEQLEFNRRRIAEAGLQDKLRVELLDYRDLPKAPTFDKIVSVGMVEHVGIKNYPIYFQSALSALKPGGLFLNHGINSSVPHNGSSLGERFIDRYIFPDGELATLSTILTAAEAAGWEVVDVDAWRPHYAKTLRCWAENFDRAFERGTAVVGERKALVWKLYLIGCSLGFQRNFMGICQTLLRRREDADWNLPLTRAGWLC